MREAAESQGRDQNLSTTTHHKDKTQYTRIGVGTGGHRRRNWGAPWAHAPQPAEEGGSAPTAKAMPVHAVLG